MTTSPIPSATPDDAAARSVIAGRLVVCVGWLFLNCLELTTIPGLEMDEAWSILSARGQWEAADPQSGMTRYAGPFPVLLLKLAFTEHGSAVLRGASVLCNTAALFMVMGILNKLHSSRSLRVWAWAVMASIPAWLVLSRVGIEISMFGPLLALIAIYLLLLREHWATGLAGVCFGLLAYNHPVGAFVPVGMLLSWCLVYRRLPPVSWRYVALGLAIGLSPRIYAQLVFRAPVDDAVTGYVLKKALRDQLFWPGALWRTLNGTAVYLNYTGREVMRVWPYWLLAVALLIPWRGRLAKIPRPPRVTFVACLIMASLSTLAAPRISVRYLLYPTIGLSIAFVQLGASAIESNPRWLRLVRVVSGVIVLANIGYLTINFYLPWYNHELKIGYFWLGVRNKTESNRSYLPKTNLVRKLRELRPAQVLASPSIEWPLRVLLPEVYVSTPQRPADGLSPTVLVAYYEELQPVDTCVAIASRRICLQNSAVVDDEFVIYY